MMKIYFQYPANSASSSEHNSGSLVQLPVASSGRRVLLQIDQVGVVSRWMWWLQMIVMVML